MLFFDMRTELDSLNVISKFPCVVIRTIGLSNSNVHDSNFAHQKHSSRLEKYGIVAKKTDSLCTFSQFF